MIYYSPHRKAHRRWRVPPRLCRTTIAVQILLLLTVSLVVCGLLEMSNMGTSLLGDNSGQEPLGGHSKEAPSQPADVDNDEHAEIEEKRYAFTYTTLTGYFAQDEPSTDPATFDFMSSNFGLIDREYDSDQSLPNGGQEMKPWQRFEHHIAVLNQRAREEADHDDDRLVKRHGSDGPPQQRYILFFLGRHGNGYHNIAERYYGSTAWDCHFSALDGDPSVPITWSDAHLSKEGKRQAREVNSFWQSQISEQGEKMSLPEAYLASPLDRTLETLQLSFEGLSPEPIVVEKLREGTGIHTCDRRSSVTYIRDHFPGFNVKLDPNLTEEDEYWDADRREPDSVLTARQRSMFDQLMTGKNGILLRDVERVSITSHSGAIAAMLRALGHRAFGLGTAGVLPVFVRVDRVALNNDDHNEKGSTRRNIERRHGGSGESAHGKDPVLDLPDLDAPQADSSDRSTWPTIPSCPADLDLDSVGQKRWGMSLKEFVDGVENGTLDPHAVPFESTG
jgi:broad specificity phosphatase PhoE